MISNALFIIKHLTLNTQKKNIRKNKHLKKFQFSIKFQSFRYVKAYIEINLTNKHHLKSTLF